MSSTTSLAADPAALDKKIADLYRHYQQHNALPGNVSISPIDTAYARGRYDAAEYVSTNGQYVNFIAAMEAIAPSQPNRLFQVSNAAATSCEGLVATQSEQQRQ